MHLKLKSWITLKNMEAGQLKGVLAHLRQRRWYENGGSKGKIKSKQIRVKKTLRSCAPKWPKLEYVKNWITDQRKNGIAVSTKMILIETRRLAIEMSITDFAVTTSWCERFLRRNGLCMCTETTIAQQLPREYERKIIDFGFWTVHFHNWIKEQTNKMHKLILD